MIADRSAEAKFIRSVERKYGWPNQSSLRKNYFIFLEDSVSDFSAGLQRRTYIQQRDPSRWPRTHWNASSMAENLTACQRR